MRIFSALSNRSWVPGLKPILEGGRAAAAVGDGQQGLEAHTIAADLVERHIGGHELGDRGRKPGISCAFRVEHLARIGIDHEGRATRES